MRNDQSTFIQVDGIDGSGKSTILAAARTWAERRGLRLFDAIEWSKREHCLPTAEDANDADVLFTAEPTHAGIGDMIRNEIIQDGAPYDAVDAAHAFALDRGVQYRRLILPFLAAQPGRWVIQDRGLLSSLAYQPLQSELEPSGKKIDIPWLLELPGNAVALDAPPDIFVFLDIDPALAQERLALRQDKVDGHKYEKTDFQIRLAERYRDPATSAPLTQRGTWLTIVNGGKTRDEVANAMTDILDRRAHDVAQRGQLTIS